MKTDRVLQLVNNCKPKTAQDTLYAGLPLKYLGDGAYREAYHIIGTELVIKLPKRTDLASTSCNVMHSLHEFHAIKRILRSRSKKCQAIKKHLPKVYYCDANGVMVVRKYNMLPNKYQSDKLRAVLSHKVCSTLKLFDGDIENSGNVGIDGRGTLKILDAGYLAAQW